MTNAGRAVDVVAGWPGAARCIASCMTISFNGVASVMNNRPRKTFGWRTPAEAIADEIEAFTTTVALEAGI
jgi:hypothetical protein